MSSTEMKEKIINDIKKLPEDSLEEIMDFISFKLSRINHKDTPAQPVQKKADSSKDPLVEYIGSIEHGSLAKDIDKELYGTSH
ncbi:MAG: hypothetical protein U5R06_04005 [candidate division KSB1 bacterium]|nr:hypothetical protein [candidate division KSB1 bacterium]